MQKQVVSKEKKRSLVFDFSVENCVLQNNKVLVSPVGRYIPSACLVVWASFFETVLFLVYKNMVPLPKR